MTNEIFVFIMKIVRVDCTEKRLRFIKSNLSKVLDKEKLSNKIKEFAKATKSSKEWQAKPQRLREGKRTAEQLTRMDGCRLSEKDLNSK